MEIVYPKIEFIYSLPYDRMLTEYENKNFQERQIKEVQMYIKKLQRRWNKISKPVYQTLNKLIKSDWQEKEIKCYVVKYCKYTGISHPLTIKKVKDFDLTLATLIHELVHIFVASNVKKYKKLEEKLKKKFPKENERTIQHIYINFIELQILKLLFSKKVIDKIIKGNLKLIGIKKAWNIVLNRGDILQKLL